MVVTSFSKSISIIFGRLEVNYFFEVLLMKQTITADIFSTPQGTTITTPTGQIILDPQRGADCSQAKLIIITSLTIDSVLFDPQPLPCPLYVSQELFTLLQKLAATDLLPPLKHHLKIIPYTYPLYHDGWAITVKANEDGLYGALVLLLTGPDQQKIGYCFRFDQGGIHNKRIKKWKKWLKASNISYLLLGQSMFSNEPTPLMTYRGWQKHLTKLLAATTTTTTFAINPWKIDQLLQLAKTAQQHHFNVTWQPQLAPVIAYYQAHSFVAPENIAEPTANLVQVTTQPDWDFRQQTSPNILNQLAIQPQQLGPADQQQFMTYFAPAQIVFLP